MRGRGDDGCYCCDKYSLSRRMLHEYLFSSGEEALIVSLSGLQGRENIDNDA